MFCQGTGTINGGVDDFLHFLTLFIEGLFLYTDVANHFWHDDTFLGIVFQYEMRLSALSCFVMSVFVLLCNENGIYAEQATIYSGPINLFLEIHMGINRTFFNYNFLFIPDTTPIDS